MTDGIGGQMAMVNIASLRPGNGAGDQPNPEPSPSTEPTVTPAATIHNDTPKPTGQVAGAGTASNLPDTGSETLLGGAMGLGTLGYGVRAWAISRKSLRDALKRK
jgi:hypothetical protein